MKMIPTPGAGDVPAELANALRRYLAFETPGEQAVAFDRLNGVRDLLHALAPNVDMPVDLVRWVPIERVVPNDYNPNHVAKVEMGLLLRSIEADGYTQPVVTVWNPERVELGVAGVFEIVDGFHRYYCMKMNAALLARCGGRLPIVVIEKNQADRMASTVRHNRARGRHSVNGMANLVFQMKMSGMTDPEVCNELGMEPEELLRICHITGFAKLYENAEFNKAWQTKVQIRLEKARLAAEATEFLVMGGGPDATPAGEESPL